MVYLGKFNILKTKVTACDYDWLIRKIFKNLNKKLIIAPVASHPITLAYFDKKIEKILEKIDIIAPDSQYVRWALKFLYGVNLKDRVYGPELFIRLLKETEEKDLKVFLIGNNLTLLIKKLKIKFPKLKISGFFELEFKKINKEIINNIEKKLKKSRANIIFVGIGSPNQHLLAVEIKKQRPIICVGAAFDFISGLKKQAPIWIRNIGFEWVFRLLSEPQRLLGRYILSFFFLILIFIQKTEVRLKLSGRKVS